MPNKGFKVKESEILEKESNLGDKKVEEERIKVDSITSSH